MGGWLFMVLLPIVVVALLVWALSASGRAYWGRGDQADNERSALQLLEERFARGEIDREEFQRRRASASEGPPAGRTWDQRPLSGAGLRGILTASANRYQACPGQTGNTRDALAGSDGSLRSGGTEGMRSTCHPSYLVGHPDRVRPYRPGSVG